MKCLQLQMPRGSAGHPEEPLPYVAHVPYALHASPFPPSPPPTPLMQQAPSTPGSPTQPCSGTPSHSSQSPPPATPPPTPRTIQPPTSTTTREYGFDLNEQWQSDTKFYGNQKIAGLTFPRTIRTSAFTSKLDIEGCDLPSFQLQPCCISSTTITG